jgi:hypothetical protein
MLKWFGREDATEPTFPKQTKNKDDAVKLPVRVRFTKRCALQTEDEKETDLFCILLGQTA